MCGCALLPALWRVLWPCWLRSRGGCQDTAPRLVRLAVNLRGHPPYSPLGRLPVAGLVLLVCAVEAPSCSTSLLADMPAGGPSGLPAGWPEGVLAGWPANQSVRRPTPSGRLTTHFLGVPKEHCLTASRELYASWEKLCASLRKLYASLKKLHASSKHVNLTFASRFDLFGKSVHAYNLSGSAKSDLEAPSRFQNTGGALF